MSQLQTVLNESPIGTSTGATPSAEGVLEGPREIEWFRTDWGRAAGTIPAYSIRRIAHASEEASFFWGLLEIPVLYLCHKSAVLLLQGQKLSSILIPNHEFRNGPHRTKGPVAHVLLRVDPWEYWKSRPVLTGLKLACLAEIPAGLAPDRVLEILIAGSAA